MSCIREAYDASSERKCIRLDKDNENYHYKSNKFFMKNIKFKKIISKKIHHINQYLISYFNEISNFKKYINNNINESQKIK